MSRKPAWRAAYIALLLLSYIGCSRALRLEQDAGRVVIDFQFLGEYPCHVERLRLSDAVTGEAVWEAVGVGEPEIGTLTFVAGDNRAAVADTRHGRYNVVRPSGSPAFALREGVRYRIEAWTTVKDKRSPASAEFVFR